MQEIIGTILMVIGLIFVTIAIFGVYRFNYVLNRMHAVAICDTLGMFFVLLGVMVCFGLSFASLKCGLILVFFWLAGPVSSHLIARLEVTTNEPMAKKLKGEDQI